MTELNQSSHPIGIFDSGVGGLSILRQIRQKLPAEDLLYVADQAHVPYGTRSLEEVQGFALGITHFLLKEKAKLIVIACNAASAAALQFLRGIFTDLPFVGMEPAVKPAVRQTHTKRVGILATKATFQGALYSSLLERFAQDVRVHENTCPGLVTQIEKGDLDGPETRRILEEALHPMLKAGVDTIVLGCTHYPFVIPVIQQITGPDINVINPSPAIALRTEHVLSERGALYPGTRTGSISLFTSSSPLPMQALLPKLIGEALIVQSTVWQPDAHGAWVLCRSMDCEH